MPDMARYYLQHNIVGSKIADPVRFKCGILSPIYVQMRKLGELTALRAVMVSSLHSVLRGCLAGSGTGAQFASDLVILPVAMGALPLGFMLAGKYGAHHAYMRPEKKDHGIDAQIEGPSVKGKFVVIFEDVVTYATSAVPYVEVVRQHGGIVVGVLSTFTYGFPEATQKFDELGVPLWSLVDFPAVRREMPNFPDIWTSNILTAVDAWYAVPRTWTTMMEERYPQLRREISTS